MPWGDFYDILQSAIRVRWETDTDFNKGTLDSTLEVSGTGDAAKLQLKAITDGDGDIPYNVVGNYTLSDGAKITVDEGDNNKAKLKVLGGGNKTWPLTTPANYTYDSDKIEIDGEARLFGNLKCLQFDGTNAEKATPYDVYMNGLGKVTVSAWVYIDSFGTNNCIYQAYGGAGARPLIFGINNNHVACIVNDGPWWEGSTTLSVDTWYYVAFTYDNTAGSPQVKVWLNGVVDGSWGKTAALANNDEYDLIGHYFSGRIDEVSLWDKALSSAELLELYNSGSPIFASDHSAYSANCTHYWKMGDDDTYSTITDLKGSGDLTMINMESEDLTDATGLYTIATDNPTVESITGFAFTVALNTFTETATKPGSDEIKYQVSSDDGTTWKWWNGSSWATITGSQTDTWYYTNEANLASVVHTNIGSLASSGTFQFRAYLHSNDATTTPELDSIFVQTPTTYSTTDNLYIDTTNTSQFSPATPIEWLTTAITNTLPANTDIRVLFSNNGRSSWLTYTGGTWQAPTSATTRTDATSITDAQNQISSLPVGDGTLDVRLFLYSSDSTTSPDVDNINFTSDSGFETSGSWESNVYNSSYLEIDWNAVTWDATTPGGTSVTIKVRAAESSGDLASESYLVVANSGADAGVTGQYLQLKIDFAGTSSVRPDLDTLAVDSISPIRQIQSP